MRALCGAIITAGALIGLGIAAVGVGTRYADFRGTTAQGDWQWVKFWQMDTPLIVIVVVLICGVIVGLGIAILGLAYHHERRHRERLRELAELEQAAGRIKT
jgi:hypothetical protein